MNVAVHFQVGNQMNVAVHFQDGNQMNVAVHFQDGNQMNVAVHFQKQKATYLISYEQQNKHSRVPLVHCASLHTCQAANGHILLHH